MAIRFELTALEVAGLYSMMVLTGDEEERNGPQEYDVSGVGRASSTGCNEVPVRSEALLLPAD